MCINWNSPVTTELKMVPCTVILLLPLDQTITHSFTLLFLLSALRSPSIAPRAYNPRILLADLIAAADPEIDLLSDERGLLLCLPDRLFLICFGPF